MVVFDPLEDRCHPLHPTISRFRLQSGFVIHSQTRGGSLIDQLKDYTGNKTFSGSPVSVANNNYTFFIFV